MEAPQSLRTLDKEYDDFIVKRRRFDYDTNKISLRVGERSMNVGGVIRLRTRRPQTAPPWSNGIGFGGCDRRTTGGDVSQIG